MSSTIKKWLAKQHEATSRRAPTTVAVEVSIPMHDKGKRKIAENPETEQSYKMRANPILEKAALAAEANREQRLKRVEQRKREK